MVGAMNSIELAKEAGFSVQYVFEPPKPYVHIAGYGETLERFAALVRADLMKQVMDTCEAEYKMYDQLVVEEDTGHEEATAMIHLMRKLEKLK